MHDILGDRGISRAVMSVDMSPLVSDREPASASSQSMQAEQPLDHQVSDQARFENVTKHATAGALGLLGSARLEKRSKSHAAG